MTDDYALPTDPKEYKRLFTNEPLPWPRYVVHPGMVMSRNDGDWHFISADKLMRLYKVDPRICGIEDEARPETMVGHDWFDRIHLYPRRDGDYRLPGEKA
jgi:hypothetical protein